MSTTTTYELSCDRPRYVESVSIPAFKDDPPTYTRVPVERQCHQCGKTVLRIKKKSDRVFCTPKCFGEYRIATRVQSGKSLRPCLVCGVTMDISRDRNKKVCSRQCNGILSRKSYRAAQASAARARKAGAEG